MTLVAVAYIRVIDCSYLKVDKGWGSDQKDRTEQHSYIDACTLPLKSNFANTVKS